MPLATSPMPVSSKIPFGLVMVGVPLAETCFRQEAGGN